MRINKSKVDKRVFYEIELSSYEKTLYVFKYNRLLKLEYLSQNYYSSFRSVGLKFRDTNGIGTYVLYIKMANSVDRTYEWCIKRGGFYLTRESCIEKERVKLEEQVQSSVDQLIMAQKQLEEFDNVVVELSKELEEKEKDSSYPYSHLTRSMMKEGN